LSRNAVFDRGTPLRWLIALASSVALLPAFQSDALGYQFGGPEVRAIGPEEMVFDFSTMKCSSEDIPDQPARAFKDSLGRVQLIDSHASVRRKIGTSLNNVQHNCAIVMDSHGDHDPAAFDDREWISATYTLDGQTIYGLTSTEYHGWEYDEECAPFVSAGQHLKCWYNSVGLVKSVDAGASYTHAAPPGHLVASSPYRYTAGDGPLGIFDPSNIIYRSSDNYYYAMVRVEEHLAQPWGACLMRTRTLDDPTSWRAWDGSGFGVSFMNPYVQTDPPGQHVCRPVSPASFPVPMQTGSLTYSTYLGKYVLLGVSQRYDAAAQRWHGGFYYSLSEDLINWSPSKIFMYGELPWTHRCGEPSPVRDPSLLDPASDTRNFETIGRRPYLYFTRFNLEYWDPNTCWATLNRDLIRIPIEFTDTSPPNQAPSASFTVSPNPAPTGQTVTFNGSASSDSDGAIANYKWDLDGNGTFETDTGTTATVTGSYPNAGTVSVKLRVTDNDGAMVETTRSLTITNRAPTASFTVSPNPALAGEVVSFNGSASSDPDGTIANYRWDLDGNGTLETDTGTTATVTRSYSSAATITVRLRVTDNDGVTGETTRNLTLDPPPVNQLPSAAFTVSPNPALTAEVVTFNGSASSDPDGSIANYKWDLDDNGSFETDTGTAATVTRSYPAAATVDVGLRVTDNDGAASDTRRRLTVSTRPPTSALDISPNPAVAGQAVTFNGSASSDPDGTIASYSWDLDGDGTFETATGSAATTTKTYSAAANVTVKLRVTDDDGAAGETARALMVHAAPVPGPPGPQGPPAPQGQPSVPSPTAAQCATLRAKRNSITRKLRKARQGLARAKSARAKRRNIQLIRKLTRQRKRLQITGCSK
jgi:PKD repeat protein